MKNEDKIVLGLVSANYDALIWPFLRSLLIHSQRDESLCPKKIWPDPYVSCLHKTIEFSPY